MVHVRHTGGLLLYIDMHQQSARVSMYVYNIYLDYMLPSLLQYTNNKNRFREMLLLISPGLSPTHSFPSSVLIQQIWQYFRLPSNVVISVIFALCVCVCSCDFF